MNIRTKVFLGMIFPGIFVALLLLVMIAIRQDYTRHVAHINNVIIPSVSLLGRIEAAGMGLLESALMPVELGEAEAVVDEGEADEYTARRLSLLQSLSEYEALLPEETALQAAAVDLLFASETMLVALTSQESRATLVAARITMEAAEDAFVNTVETAIEAQNARIANTQGYLTNIATVGSVAVVGLLVLSAAAAVIFGWWFSRQVTASIGQLAAAADAYAAGQLDVRAEVQSGDEIGDLAQVFNHMADDIQKMNAQLTQRIEERTAQLYETDSVRLDRERRLEQTNSFTLRLLDDLQQAVEKNRPRQEMGIYLIKARSEFTHLR